MIMLWYFLALLFWSKNILALFNSTKILQTSCNVSFNFIIMNVTYVTSISTTRIKRVYLAYSNVAVNTLTAAKDCHRDDTSTSSVRCRLLSVHNTNAYRLRLVLKSADQVVLAEVPIKDYYVPNAEGFYCYSDHRIKDFKISLATDESISVSWQYKSYDRNFYAVTANLLLYDYGRKIKEVRCSDVLTMNPAVCKIPNLKACNTYKICVHTNFNVGNATRITCINATTLFQPQVPIDLKTQCLPGKQARLIWKYGELRQDVPPTYFTYVIQSNESFVEENTTHHSVDYTAILPVTASLRTCSECGCSSENQISAPACVQKAEGSRSVLIILVLLGLLIAVVTTILLIRRHRKFLARRRATASENQVISPRGQSPIYESINEVSVNYDAIRVGHQKLIS